MKITGIRSELETIFKFVKGLTDTEATGAFESTPICGRRHIAEIYKVAGI